MDFGSIKGVFLGVVLFTFAAIITVILRRSMPIKVRLIWLIAIVATQALGAMVWFGYLIRTRGQNRPAPADHTTG